MTNNGSRFLDEANEEFWNLLAEKFAREFPDMGKEIAAIEASPGVMDAFTRFVEMARDIGYDRGLTDGVWTRNLEIAMDGEDENDD